VWPKLALTGISGTIAPNGDPGRYDVDLAGGYGGVAGTLWTAQGWIDPAQSAGAIDATADQFTFGRIAPILERSPVKDFDNTSIDGKLHLDIGRDQIGFAGSFHLAGLNIFDLRLADDEVKDIELVGDLAGTYTRATRTVRLDKGAFESRGLPFEVTGWWALPGGDMGGGVRRERHALDAIWTIPPIDCQKALLAIPTELAPMMDGYRLSGTFRSRIHVGIDWANLEATTLVDDSSVRIRDCKVKDRPDDSPLRLRDQFEHFVELDQDEWISFVVGPDNDDYVPLSQISPYLLKSLMTTEDSNFYNHHGFIVKEFQSALIKNLQAGRFKYGASSITMQLVKNVLLYRKKTLSRKLQELFLTWDIENVLDKDRIFEIYVNVIEYGPGLYGIGPAAKQYFGKHPRDLNVVEAAFFSSILPHPKDSYKQYCEGTLTRITSAKIERILDRMHERKRITDEEYAQAQATPLLFSKDGTESDKDCLDRTIRAIKRQRSTNPTAKDKDKKPKKDR
jgi:hypothetical protein